MIVQTKLEIKDDVQFVADYCETGSSLEIQNAGNVLIRIDCMPPAILVRLRDALNEEIAKGARKNCFEKRLQPGERRHEEKKNA